MHAGGREVPAVANVVNVAGAETGTAGDRDPAMAQRQVVSHVALFEGPFLHEEGAGRSSMVVQLEVTAARPVDDPDFDVVGELEELVAPMLEGTLMSLGPGSGLFDVPMLERDLKENIIPLVEKQYRAGTDRSQRAIAGLSIGGYQSLALGLTNLPMFAYVGAFSSALVGPGVDSLVKPFLEDPAKSNSQLKLLWMGCGGDDGLLAPNRRFEQLLVSKGIRHEWVVTPGYAHSWTCGVFISASFCRSYSGLSGPAPKQFHDEGVVAL